MNSDLGLGQTYFDSPDYLAAQCWVHTTFFTLILLIQHGQMYINVLSSLSI